MTCLACSEFSSVSKSKPVSHSVLQCTTASFLPQPVTFLAFPQLFCFQLLWVPMMDLQLTFLLFSKDSRNTAASGLCTDASLCPWHSSLEISMANSLISSKPLLKCHFIRDAQPNFQSFPTLHAPILLFLKFKQTFCFRIGFSS